HAYLSLFFALAANSSRSASTERPTPLTHTLSLHDALPISETAPDFTGAVSHFLLVRRLVNTNRTTRWIVHFFERFIPFDRFSGRDRKSTRLNSSHVSISYAVFCLKKKIQALRGRWPRGSEP